MLCSGLQIPGSSQNHLLSIRSVHLCPPTSTNTSSGSTQNSLWCSQPRHSRSWICLGTQGRLSPGCGRWGGIPDGRLTHRQHPGAHRGRMRSGIVVLGKATGNGENSRKCSNPVFLGESSSVAGTDGWGTDVTGATGKRPDPHGGMRLCPRRTGDAQHPGSGRCLQQAFMDKQASCLLPP